jgi:ribosomal protein S18 acetylase RimI-like enzyme
MATDESTKIIIEKCNLTDAPLLARLNKQLIEDEGSSNPMSISELEMRMHKMLSDDYEAVTFSRSDGLVGYALTQISRNPLYLRQFFICREKRRCGYGKNAFRALLTHYDAETIELEVLVGNKAGLVFWRSLGLVEHSVMLYLPNTS